jgi:hypothetical protein
MADGSPEIAGVHPLADLFPMMEEDDLQGLADSIAANGQRDAILLDPTGLLLDGRNRLAACKRASVEPRFEVFDGDPVALIHDKNVERRFLSKGQRAMATAFAYPKPKMGRPSGDGKSAENADFQVGERYVRMARFVRRHDSDDAAKAVLAGGVALDVAYQEAIKVKERNESYDGRLERLRVAAPDLATEVSEGTMTLAKAEAELRERLAREAARASSRRLVGQNIELFFKRAEVDYGPPNSENLRRGLADPDERADYLEHMGSLGLERLAKIEANVLGLIAMLRGLEDERSASGSAEHQASATGEATQSL